VVVFWDIFDEYESEATSLSFEHVIINNMQIYKLDFFINDIQITLIQY
jgi:hypothetical protein